MCVIFMIIYFLVGDDVSVNNEILLVTDFMNLKIKSDQSFENAHRGRVCVRVFVRMNDHIYICLYYILKKQKTPPTGEIELGIHLLTTMIKHQPEKEGFVFLKKEKKPGIGPA
jgi:hypothetical protein